ncbi:MAG: zinc ribbon domain-containing protein [Acidobacteriota bacterium]
MSDELDRLFECLVQALSQDARLALPFPAADLYERLVPYRSNRSRLKVATHQDYEMTVLRLLAGERGLVQLDPPDVREGMQREVTAANPDTAFFRNFPDARVMINRFAAERVLRGDAAGYAPPPAVRAMEPELEGEDPEEDEPISWTSENPIPPVEFPAAARADIEDAPGFEPSAPAFELADTEEAVPPRQCPYCGGSLPANRKVNFCPHCGQPPSGELKCPACGSEVDVGWAYCIGCGRATGFE